VRYILTLITLIATLTTLTNAEPQTVRRTTKSFCGAFFKKRPVGDTIQTRRIEKDRPFTGYKFPTTNPATLKTINIGLFSPTDPQNKAAQQLHKGIQLAVQQANRNGGYRGVPYQIIQRWAGDPWGAGSREVIKLVYQDRVWAIIAYRDGAGHIAQQISVKAYVPVIAPLSTAQSVTATGVPWIFRLPPEDNQLARQVISEALEKNPHPRIGMVSGTDHDSRFAAEAVENALNRAEVALAFHFKISPTITDKELQTLILRIRRFQPDSIFLCFPLAGIPRLLTQLNSETLPRSIYMPWVPGLDIAAMQETYHGELYMVVPFRWAEGGDAKKEFRRQYRQKYVEMPGYSAFYGYDAVQRIIRSIEKNGLSRASIRTGLSEIK